MKSLNASWLGVVRTLGRHHNSNCTTFVRATSSAWLMQQSGLFYSHGLHRELPHVVILESVTDVSGGDDQRDGLWIDQSKKTSVGPMSGLHGENGTALCRAALMAVGRIMRE